MENTFSQLAGAGLPSPALDVDLLRDMAVFVAVANAKSFSRAAAALGMPVSSVSRRVSELEGRLGVPLFTRTTRQVQLTEAGAEYFERCRSILDAAEIAHEDLRGHAGEPRGHLRVSVTPDFAMVFLTPLFAEFARRYPDISFDFDLSPRWVDLVGEGFDVAIRIGTLPETSTLTVRKLVSVETSVYASDAYLAHAGEPREPADLEEHDCIRILRPHDTLAVWSLTRGGDEVAVTVKGRFATNSPRLMLRLAVLGMGVAVVDDDMARPELESGALRRLLPEWRVPPVPIYAITPSRRLPAKTRLFIDCLVAHLDVRRRSSA